MRLAALLPRLALVLAVVPASAAFGDAKSHEASVRAFFKAAQMDTLINSTLEQMTEMQVRANPAVGPYRKTLLEFFKKYMSWDSLEPELVQLYVKEFTEHEIKEITKFYQTEVGKKVMKKLPELSAKGAAIGQSRVQAHIGELQEMLEKAQKQADKAAEKATPAPAPAPASKP